ncbi:MAG TPA: FAD:protein FMN transferase [Spirochaetales bacterium]|nr:FAD:protein FMN transferase [Spirochaetales bacterium]
MRKIKGLLLFFTLPFFLISCRASLYKETRPSMSTLVAVLVSGVAEPDWQELYSRAEKEAALFDHRLPGSPLKELNEGRSPELPVKLIKVLRLAMEIAEKSGGAFDPTILPLISLWNFDSGGELPDKENILAARNMVDYRRVKIDAQGVVELPPGWGFDLGGIAKGAVVDQIADYLNEEGYENFLIDAGGDILVSGLKRGKEPWSIGIRHPRSKDKLIGLLHLGGAGESRAVVTSGDYERYFEYGGKRYHHILDPSSGYPADNSIAVTVIAPTCSRADGLATAAFVLGPDQGLELLEELPGVEGMIIAEGISGSREYLLRTTSAFPLTAEELKLAAEELRSLEGEEAD